MPTSAEEAAVRKCVLVCAGIDRAFSVFVEQMETWWPATHPIGSAPFESIFVEPRIGGRWYERSAQGEQCDWGKIIAWDPPHRVCFAWHLGPGDDKEDWKFDPDPAKPAKSKSVSSPKDPQPLASTSNIAASSATAKATRSSSPSSMDPTPGWASSNTSRRPSRRTMERQHETSFSLAGRLRPHLHSHSPTHRRRSLRQGRAGV